MPKRKLTAAELLSFNLRRLMAERGSSEAEIAKAIGIPGRPAIAAMNLRGDYLGERPKWPRPDRIDRMAEVLDVPRSELLREIDEGDHE